MYSKTFTSYEKEEIDDKNQKLKRQFTFLGLFEDVRVFGSDQNLQFGQSSTLSMAFDCQEKLPSWGGLSQLATCFQRLSGKIRVKLYDKLRPPKL